MRLDLADKIAERLLARFDPDGEGGCFAGSVRRRKPEPRDIEILLPWSPPPPEGDDAFYNRIAAMCPRNDRDLNVFDESTQAPSGGPWFQVVRGLKPGFRAAQLLCLAATDPRWAKLESPDFKIDIFRFDPAGVGHGGNFGWVLLQRTGPAEFGEACLAHFKRNGGSGSSDGYLIDGKGQPIPTLHEIDAFRAMHVAYVEPTDRLGYESIRPQHDWHEPIPEEAIPF
ncbi:MAG: hypothetical protein IT445_00165 [Phycisphaeraceae bacterium]|nr:hypothetical protein [Phycisphaeraceae bacterium]